MPQAETRKLAAIMFTDMVGFSRQMGADETRMLRVLEAHNQILQQAVTEHQGHVIKTMGDAFLVDFPSVVHAVSVPSTFKRNSAPTTPRKRQTSRSTSVSVFTWATSCNAMAMCLGTG